MFTNRYAARSIKAFEAQFEEHGSGYIYRKGSKGPPIPVSGQERDQFVETFKRHQRYAMLSIIPATILLIFALVLSNTDPDSTAGNIELFGGIGLILALYFLYFLHCWNAPAQALERRAAIGPALNREEVRRKAFSKLTYRQLATASVMGVAGVFHSSFNGGNFHRPAIGWILMGGLVVIFAGIQAVRKWRFDAGQNSSGPDCS
ncbi:hypothetical protein GCM10023219_31210 [Stakelama sediminis]|uniref:Uncharacterized protein n=1 Tax=Stakelama sediminis TaxID=463200 RepID=A0A840Z136_9SPHN|nr:hypothetical protein [Stakelama sediminis]MBB5719688.1 hypothetical protein [Stakelama sediminis]